MNPANFIKESRSNEFGEHTTGGSSDQEVVRQVAVIGDSSDWLLVKSCRGRQHRRRSRVMTGSSYVLAIDQGTTSTRAMLFDARGRARCTVQIELTQHYPQPGWV